MDDVRKHFNNDEWATIQRIQKMFDVLGDLTGAVYNNTVTGLIVYGPPGVSKTHTVIEKLNDLILDRIFKGKTQTYVKISGVMKTPHLYKELWDAQQNDCVLVIDDCDSALQDPDSLMLLKAALDSNKKRTVTYNAVSPLLKQYKIPNTFTFTKSVIFITNTDFKNTKALKIKDHLAAIMSRCHYIDININTDEEKLLWIKYIALSTDMLTDKGLSTNEILTLLKYIETNVLRLNDLSLRAALKLADLFTINKTTWTDTAEVTMLTNAA